VSTDSDEGDTTVNLSLSSNEDKDKAADGAGKQGTLTIRVMLAEGLTLPASKEVPKAIRDALASEEGQQAQDVSVGSISQSVRLSFLLLSYINIAAVSATRPRIPLRPFHPAHTRLTKYNGPHKTRLNPAEERLVHALPCSRIRCEPSPRRRLGRE
jgi:hypothetical protein